MQPAHTFRNIGIISRPRRSNLSEVAPPLLSWLQGRGIHVAYDQETASSLAEPSEGRSREQVAAASELLLVLGGDGDAGCAPGAYSGTYQCSTTPDSSFQAMMSGSISLTLTGDRGGPTLYIAPGTQVSSEQQGVTSTSELSGTLDCLTSKLAGTLSHVTFTSVSFNGTFNGTGDLSADYDGRASPPAFVNGIMVPPQAQGALAGLQAQAQGTCTWMAILQ